MPEHKSYTSRSAKKPTKHKQTFFHRPNLLMPEITVTSTKPAFPKPGECIIAIGQHPQAGKKQKAMVPMVCGIALVAFTYFISNVYMLVIVGALLVVLPYFVRI